MGKPSLCVPQPSLLLPKAIRLSPPRPLLLFPGERMKTDRPGLGPAHQRPVDRLWVTRGVRDGGRRRPITRNQRRTGGWGAPPAGRVSGVRSFSRFGAVAPGPFPGVLPLGPPATEPRGRILTCQTRPGRVYNSPALAPGAAASPALRWDSRRARRARRRTTPGSKPARLAPARTRTRTRAHTRALTLTLSFTTRAHTQTRALPLCTRAHTHTRVLPRAHVCSHSQAHFHALRLPHARHAHKRSHSHSGPFTPQGRRHRRRGRREDPRPFHG